MVPHMPNMFSHAICTCMGLIVLSSTSWARAFPRFPLLNHMQFSFAGLHLHGGGEHAAGQLPLVLLDVLVGRLRQLSTGITRQLLHLQADKLSASACSPRPVVYSQALAQLVVCGLPSSMYAVLAYASAGLLQRAVIIPEPAVNLPQNAWHRLTGRLERQQRPPPCLGLKYVVTRIVKPGNPGVQKEKLHRAVREAHLLTDAPHALRLQPSCLHLRGQARQRILHA